MFLPDVHERMRFGPLRALVALRHLDLDFDGLFDEFSEEQVDELRMLPWLESFQSSCFSNSALVHLTRLPHDLRWKSLGPRAIFLVDESAAAIGRLPSLTELVAQAWRGSAPFPQLSGYNFLRELTNLRRLELDCKGRPESAGGSLLDSLQRCTQITELQLTACQFTSEHLVALLPCLPHLARLTLIQFEWLESLAAFSSSPPLVESLRHLRIDRSNAWPLADLVHLHGLRSLRTFEVILPPSRLEEDGDADRLLASLTLPASAVRFPHLQYFHHE
jgi:hypothetical protein